MSTQDYTETDKHEDIKVLHGMGYAQELQRSMSRFSNFAISFSIICILSGGINSFAQATSSIGGAGAGIGWIVGCCVSGFFALAMAQIASAYPTAGGLYHWASILGNRFTGWLTAWLNLLGLITVLGAINIGTSFFFVGTFGGSFGLPARPVRSSPFVAVITMLQALFNHFGIKLTAMLTDCVGLSDLRRDGGADRRLPGLCAEPSTSRGCGPSPTTRVKPAATCSRSRTRCSTSSCSACCCRSTPSPATTPRRIPRKRPSRRRTRFRGRSSRRSLWSSLVGWVMLCAIVLAIPDMAAGAKQGWACSSRP